MELRDALLDIAEIRERMVRGQTFRGYRAAMCAFSGLVAVVTAGLQHWALGNGGIGAVVLWAAAAGMCVVVMGVEMAVRTMRSASVVQRQLTLSAVEAFVPCVVAGGLVTWAFGDFLPAQVWMLPGLWMILFSLGVFASVRLLPREVFGVAGFYLIAGVATLMAGGAGRGGFSPWVMGGVFGAGQGALAGILYFRLERSHDREE